MLDHVKLWCNRCRYPTAFKLYRTTNVFFIYGCTIAGCTQNVFLRRPRQKEAS